jgi:hypothetical protein
MDQLLFHRETQRVPQALGIKYHIHLAWRTQSFSKVEKNNQTINQTLANLCQETSGKWTLLLPRDSLRLEMLQGPRFTLALLKCSMGVYFSPTT